MKVKNKIQEDITSAMHLSFTRNAWTASSANISFQSLTCHLITEICELKSAILKVTPL